MGLVGGNGGVPGGWGSLERAGWELSLWTAAVWASPTKNYHWIYKDIPLTTFQKGDIFIDFQNTKMEIFILYNNFQTIVVYLIHIAWDFVIFVSCLWILMYDDDFTHVFLQMIWIETGSTAALGIDVDDSALEITHSNFREKYFWIFFLTNTKFNFKTDNSIMCFYSRLLYLYCFYPKTTMWVS